jgi:hypothetical protein
MEIILISPQIIHNICMQLLLSVGLWFLVICAILVDLWDRVYTQKKIGKPVFSDKIRDTVDKFTEYWRFLLIAFVIDSVIFVICTLLGHMPIPVLSALFSVGLVGVELKSLFEHAKERKSSVVEMQELIRVVISAASDRDAKKAIKDISNYLNTNKK